MAQTDAAREGFGIPLPNITFRSPPQSAAEGSAADETSELIKRSVADSSALEQLYLRYKSDVFAFSLSLYNNRTVAEDCVQETFIRLPSAAKSFKEGGSAAAFILGIAKNVSRELYRSEMRFRSGAAKMEAQLPLADAPQTGVLELARGLPKKYRAVLMLRVYSEMPFKEIARLMRLPESTVKSRYARALEILARKLKNGDENKKGAEERTKTDEK